MKPRLSDVDSRKTSSAIFGKFARKLLASGLSFLVAFQPVLLRAQEVAPDAGAAAINRPGIGAAPNGVPLIDIVTPNSQGLSHNKYDSFNVGTPGLILNNFNGEVGTSKLGGITPGNANLKTSGPASIILNEVTSGKRSALNGPAEVFGGRADVIIANPNGITCDGCGFINTPHATLTTGVPDIGLDGRLEGFTVRGGDVTFGAKGANLASGEGAVDLFDIVSRSVKVDGPVYGKDVRLTAGASKFNYATGEATELDGVSGTPEYAIDGSALGAMQAGRIKMVVTEKGAGVRMRGDLAANAGELSLSADGKISVGNASASQGLTVKSGSSVQAGKLTSKARVSIQAKRGITLETVAADGDVALAGGDGLLSVVGDVSSLGAIKISSAGVSAGNLDGGDLIDIVSSLGGVAVGDTRSRGALTISAVSGAIAANSLLSYDNVSLTAGSDLTVANNVTAGGNITASASAIASHAMLSGVDFAATAQSPSSGVVLGSAGATTLTATQGSIAATDLLSAGNLTASAVRDLTYETLQSNGDATLSTAAGSISLDKTTRAIGNISLTATSVDLSNGRSGVATSGTLTVNANTADFSNSTLTLGGLDAKLTGVADLTGAKISALTTSGGSGDITIEALSATTSSSTALLAEHNLNLTLSDFINAGQVAAKGDLDVTVTGNLINGATGLIYAGGDANFLVAGSLINNQGAIVSANDLAIAGASASQRNRSLTNTSGEIRAGGDLSILTESLTNERLTTPTWTNVLVSSGVAAGFNLNPGVAGLPFAYMESQDQNSFQLYPGMNPPQFSDYQPLLWSVATLGDGTSYHAWTWISGNGPTLVGPIFDWIRARVPKDANGNPILDPNNPSRYFIVDQVVSGGKPDYSTTYSWDYGANLSQAIYEDRFTPGVSPEASIRAGGNLVVDATNATNAYSVIEADGNATFKGGSLTNTGMSLSRTTTTTCIAQGACQAYDANGNRNPSKDIANGTTIVSKVESIGGASAIIRAGGALDLSGVDNVNNSTAGVSIAGATAVSPPTGLIDPTAVLSSMTASAALFSVTGATGAALIAALAQAPVDPKSGGVGGSVPGQSFLYETRAAYLDLGTFYGSGYFATKIGYEPDRQIPFLGDAYFENQFIDQQLRQLAGQGLGSHSFLPGSDAVEQVKQLLDQGVAFANSHQLAMGQVLSPEQVAALTEPLVWYEKKVVNGIEVLVPVVYIPTTELAKLTTSGALIAADSVTIDGNAVSNSGAMVAKNDLSVSGASIAANGGSFVAGGNVTLASSGSLTLSAQSVDLGGQTMVVPAASVQAGGDASLSAGSDLTLKGAGVAAGANATLSANNIMLDVAKATNGGQENATGSAITGRDITIAANDNVNVIGSSAKADKALSVTAANGSVNVVSTGLARETSDGYTTTRSTDQQQSQLSAGTDATIKAGDDILIAGSSLKADGNAKIEAGDDVNIVASQDRSDSTFGKNTASATTHTGSEIRTGGSASVAAGADTGDHDLNIIGSSIQADGKVDLKASSDITIAAVTDTSETDASWKSGRTKLQGHFGSETTVGSSISGGDGIATNSGGDTLVSASKLQAGDDNHSADLSMATGGDLLIASGHDTATTDVDSQKKGFLSKKTSHQESYDETTVASELSASGNIKLNAGGNAAIVGSKVTADQAISLEADSVAVIGALEQHQFESSSKKSGLFAGSGSGFISLWGKAQKDAAQASEFNVASVLSAGTDVTLKARETDVDIIGSGVNAGQDIAIDAARDVNITPGAESSSASEQEKRSGFGISYSAGNGGASIGIGFGKSVDKTTQSAETNATSTLSAGRDITISAGRDVNLQAANVEAERDVAVLADRDVNLLSAQDRSNYEHLHEEFFAGVALSVSSGLVSSASSVVEAASKIGGSNGSQSVAFAAIAGINAYSALADLATVARQGTPQSLISTSLTAGFQQSKSSDTSLSSSPVPTLIRGGNSVSIEATSGDLTSNGAQIIAGYNSIGDENGKAGDITLSAGHDVVLKSAETMNANTSKNSSVGLQVGLDLSGASFNYATGKANGSSVSQINSHVNGTGDVYIQSGNDTKLQGAVVSGDSVVADIGHDLIVESQLDIAAQSAKQLSGGGGFGSGGFGLSGTYQKANGEAAVVSEQSGIHAGSSGFDITVGNNTTLIGGVISSQAPASDNWLQTGTLEWQDIDTFSKWQADTYGGGLSLLGPSLAPHLDEGESATGKALAAISPAQIVITDTANQSQNVGDLRRNTANTNTSLPGLPDLQNILREQLKTQQLYQDASAKAAKAIGDISLKLEQGAKTPEERAYWAEGGVGRAALHALAGGLLGGVTDVNGIIKGALGGASSALLGPSVRQLVAEIVDSANISDPALRTFLINSISSGIVEGIGAGIGGSEGAAYAGNAFQYNYLTHKELEDANRERAELLDEIAKCKATTNTSCNPAQLVSLEADLSASTAYYQQLSDANNAALATACAASFSSDACVRGRRDLQNAVDEENALQAHVLGTSTVNTADALLLGVLNDVATNRISSNQIASSYQQALATDQKITAGVAGLALLTAVGVVVGPEIYAYCSANTASCANLVTEALDCVATVACTATAGGVLSAGAATKIAVELEQVAKASTAAEQVALKVPGRVQSRINLSELRTVTTPPRANGNPVSSGLTHVVDSHFNRELTSSRSVFSITLDELKTILQSPRVVASPVTALPGGQFVRTVDVGKIVGATNLTEGGLPTSVIKVFTDRAGNLITSYPVK
ncbi:hemagglutinin repeat-containing protein [Rhizobium sp. S163]|uniref:hemagglutinin repeat-containing protein n=1 Tax=Rhizobium sp. S163 TaxID=3055039 RepID=UPI0025A9DB5A|nr:hemagglutinin repeat-containing protein [Rhizobium sp. S163]MDM9645788.1 hemagglutinin repeat-containing protein [Rhizobium sp. S163]